MVGFATFAPAPAFAQVPQAILVDGPGPWQDAQWIFTVAQFSGLLTDSGYSVTMVAPQNLTRPNLVLQAAIQ